MSFANPLLLVGLLGASVPIIIHLINRRRPRKQPFPAMELLLRSAQKVERRWRLRRFLLLLLRVLLLAALALAAAGPLLGEDRERRRKARNGPERVAWVIDASLSMRARYKDRSAFSRALAEVREQISRLGPEDRALVVFTGSPAKIPVERPTSDRGRLLGVLAEAEPGWGPAPLAEAVSAAATALGRPEGQGAENATDDRSDIPCRVVVLSDLARPALDGPASLEVPGFSAPAELEVIDVLRDIPAEKRVNHGVVAVLAEQVPGESRRTVEFITRIQAFGGEAEEPTTPRTLTLSQSGRKLVEGVVEVHQDGLTQKALEYAFDRAGRQPCTILLESDQLQEDDVHYLSVDVRREVRTLVIDGDPSGVAKEDEVFYLERALEAGASDHPAPRVIGADDLAQTDLEQFDVLVLAGVPTLSRPESERIIKFVKGGGGLWVTATEGIDVESYSRGLAPVLPRALRSFKLLGEERQLFFEGPDLEHPVLRLFTGEALGGLLTTRTTGILLFDPKSTGPEMNTLLRFEGGAPALVIGNPGQGRVAVLATSIDRDLTDLPIRPAFVPLVRHMILWLGAALSEQDRRRTLVGEARDLKIPNGATRLEVALPDGRTQRFGLGDFRGGQVRFLDTARPGHYAVRVAFGGALEPLERANFAVNVDPTESDLRPLQPSEATAILLGESDLAALAPSLGGSGSTRRRLDARGLSTLLLGLFGLAFLFESAVTALRIGR